MIPYYDKNGITIYCGDCMEVIPELPLTYDLIITSPPYNLQVTTGGGFVKGNQKRTGKWSGGNLASGYNVHSDALSPDKYIEWQKKFLLECWNILNTDGAIFYNHKPRIQNGILQTPLELNPGLPLRQIIIWKRAGGINFSPTHYLPTHEWIMLLVKPGFRLKSKGASGIGDVWDITQEGNNSHPAPFPVGLPARIIETTVGTILDPFMGSGTTLVAAQNANRQATGVEISEEYCKMAVDRLEQSLFFSLPSNMQVKQSKLF